MEIVPDAAPTLTTGPDRSPTLGPDRAPGLEAGRPSGDGAPVTAEGVIDAGYGLAPSDEVDTLMDRALQARAQIAQTQTGAQTIAQADPAVDRAVETVEGRLDRGLTDPAITRGDLNAIEDAVGALTPTQATRTFERLADDTLVRLGNQLADGTPVVGGFDEDGRAAFYGTLAAKLDGAQLARLADALDTGIDRAGGAEGELLGRAIDAHAGVGARVGFVREAGDLSQTDDEAAVAVGVVVSGLRGRGLDEALKTLDTGEVRAVVDASVSETGRTVATGAGGHYTVTYDGDGAERLLGAVATASDPYARAVVLEAATERLAEVEEATGFGLHRVGMTAHDGGTTDQLRDGITGILQRDPNAVVDQLNVTVDPDGRALSSYMASMVRDGREDAIGDLLTRVGTANGTRDAADLFGEQVQGSDGRPFYKHAQELGYVVGAVQAGIESVTSDETRQAGIVRTVFTTSVGLAGRAGGAAGGVAATVLSGVGTEVVNEVAGEIAAGRMELNAAFRDLAFPRETTPGPDGQPARYEGGARTDYDAAVGRVLDAN